MKFNFALPALLKPVLSSLKKVGKHHYFIVMVVVFGGLAAAVYMVNETLHTNSDASYRDEQLQATIGSKFTKNAKDTIERIKSLQKTSVPNAEQTPLPAGRINPFAE